MSNAKVFHASFSLQNARPIFKKNVSIHSSSEMNSKVQNNFLKSMEAVYGPFSKLDSAEDALKWTPPPASDGHRGRYLWTDAFGVLNFLTLFKETRDETYLVLSRRLISTVHKVLGRTRDGTSRLPGATDQHPLNGGLRIGKNEEDGRDGDGQYHHYLTLWMFALNRMSLASGDRVYNDLAVELAKTIHPHFVYDRESARPRMYWKMSMDLSHNLVSSEGGLDPIDGFVVYTLLQRTAGDESVLAEEIADYFKIVKRKYAKYSTDDPLDIGMSLWTCHFVKDEMPWAAVMSSNLQKDLRELLDSGFLDQPMEYRLAFREFGMCLGMQCQTDLELYTRAVELVSAWEDRGIVPIPTGGRARGELDNKLSPITMVMYATALFPGAFKKDYFQIGVTVPN